MLTQGWGIGSIFAAAEAELLVGHEVGPFVQLHKLAGKRAREDKAADRVT